MISNVLCCLNKSVRLLWPSFSIALEQILLHPDLKTTNIVLSSLALRDKDFDFGEHFPTFYLSSLSFSPLATLLQSHMHRQPISRIFLQ